MLWVDISLLVISIILMIREFFPKIEEYYKKRKKIVHIVLIVGMFGLSITNIIQTNNENKDLITTAKTTLTKIDSVYQGQLNNYSSINQSVEEIKKVDSVLGGVKDSIQSQVKLLDSAIGKSQELIRLEQLDFESKKAELSIKNLKLSTVEGDSSKVRIVGDIKSTGRKAIIKYSGFIVFKLGGEPNTIKFLTSPDNTERNWITFEMEPNSSFPFLTGAYPLSEVKVENNRLFLVHNIIYQDFVTKKIYKEPLYIRMTLPFNEKNRFSALDQVEINAVNNILKRSNLYNNIYPSEFY